MPGIRDSIGRRGEGITANLLTRRHNRPLPYFNPVFLGDKQDGIDFYVELLEPDKQRTLFFLIQVKATGRGYYGNGRLRARANRSSIQSLQGYPAPTYVIGVDERTEAGYLVAVLDGQPFALASLPTEHDLSDETTLRHLHSEVIEYWSRYSGSFTVSRFAV